MTDNASSNPVDQIPSSAEVRTRLAANLREGRLLRSLLRLSQKAEVVRRQSPAQEAEGERNA